MKFIIIDRHPLFLDALAVALRAGWPDVIVTPASSLTEGLELVALGDVDLVLGCFRSLDALDVQGLRRLVGLADPAPVISISHHVEPASVIRALGAGVRGCLPKTMSGEIICNAVSVVLAGGVCFPTQALSRLAQIVHTQDGSPALSARDLDVLTNLARGSSNKIIARELGLSIATVKLSVQAILRQTGAKNRTEAIVTARRLGLLSHAL